MYRLLALVLAAFLIVPSAPVDDHCCVAPATLVAPAEPFARRCNGGACSACSSCTGCQHCAKAGGSCSVCTLSTPTTPAPAAPVPSPIPPAATPVPIPRSPTPPRVETPVTPPPPPPVVVRPPAVPEKPAITEGEEDASATWQLRSRHFVYGMPVPSDGRYRFKLPSGREVAGISVIVKEGFVVGHNDQYKVPAWVAMRWTEKDYRQSEREAFNDRPWAEDDELPNYAVGGTSYDNATSGMQRGHMARQQDLKAWGEDNVREGAEMSNIVPQSGGMNNGAWGKLEDAHRAVVANPASEIKAVWVISGPLFYDRKPRTFVGRKIGVPDACYKVVAWFDKGGKFNARGFIVRQDDASQKPEECLARIDDIELGTGLDFFPELPAKLEEPLEAAVNKSLWK